jgi:penicillin amidase
MRTLSLTVLALLLMALDLTSPLRAQTVAAASTAVRERNWQVAGLGAPADIVIDHWGIAHIFAASVRDAFFLQGYNAARDRLWQIDLWRKRGLGLLSKSLGAAYLDQDRAARLFLYRGDMDKEWGAYAPDSHARVAAFVEGINAYVAEVRSKDKPLPFEFELTARTVCPIPGSPRMCCAFAAMRWCRTSHRKSPAPASSAQPASRRIGCVEK